jgi:alginate O-acetyltransferase complex protein AlgI
MNFFSPTFFGYFLIVLLLYYNIKSKYQKIVLFLSSSFFIGFFSISFLIYTYLFIAANYSFSLLLSRFRQNVKIRKIVVNSGIFLNIGTLVFFKYSNFLIDSVSQLLHFLNYSSHYSTLKIILPIGISYYTFQGISYLLQIYRGNEFVERNILVFSNYFIFFPKFLAGPIELSKNFIPQLKQYYDFYPPYFSDGLRLILWGAFKKMVIADRLYLIVNGVYPNLDSLSGNILIITFLLQPVQLYCDFSGYTDIALGIGKSFGLNLTNNFKRPFFSTSVTMFWQRWHISLTSWCNEFIFRRLSFKIRKWKMWATVFSAFITFLVIGIWHGPRWNFIILGLLQGIAINYEFFSKKVRLKIAARIPKGLVKYSSYTLTYLFFCLTLIFFNAPKISDVGYFFSNMFVNIDLSSVNAVFLTRFDEIIIMLSILLLIVVEIRQELGNDIFVEINSWPKFLRFGLYYVICVFIIYFGSPVKEFVYMQF